MDYSSILAEMFDDNMFYFSCFRSVTYFQSCFEHNRQLNADSRGIRSDNLFE